VSDTQWPRFEVFVQARPDRAHEHVGSVHAPDRELALLNARDVFVRRPECVGLWLAPAGSVIPCTAQELVAHGGRVVGEAGAAIQSLVGVPVHVFAKLDPKGTLVHLGEMAAPADEPGLWQGVARMAGRSPLVVWLVPSDAISRNEPEQAESLFSPASDKPFRDQAYYRVYTALRRLRQESDR
jgi:ring-1,2-phenylacetyl-CoA epoxidase subunit PaaB